MELRQGITTTEGTLSVWLYQLAPGLGERLLAPVAGLGTPGYVAQPQAVGVDTVNGCSARHMRRMM